MLLNNLVGGPFPMIEVGHSGLTKTQRSSLRSCPACGHLTGKVHDRREQTKADISIGGRELVLILVKRRFRCLFCKNVFTEPDEICGWRRKITRRLREELYQEARGSTVKAAAQRRGVSQDTVRRAVAEGAAEELRVAKSEPVRHLGMDDFAVRKGQKYQTAFHDLDAKRVLGVVEGRTKEAVTIFLEKLTDPDSVEAVSMDMNGAYKSAVNESLPEAEIVVDKFHVIKRVNEQLDRLRIRLQAGQSRKEVLYKGRYLLLKNREDLDVEGREKLERLFKPHPQLRRAYLLKEDFRRWYRPGPKASKRLELAAWMGYVEHEGPGEFKELIPMLKTWKEEILGYPEFGLTQGFVEGKNTRTKAIIRQAYGYRNLDNLNLRIMLPAA